MTTSRAANLEQRVLEAIRRHFRSFGSAPSYIDIGLAVGVAPRHVGRPLKGLVQRGLITRTAGAPRSIVLARRLTNYSDDEIELEVAARGGRVCWSRLPELAQAYSVAECGIGTDAELHHLMHQLMGAGDGAQGRSEEKQGR